jgi:O-antigen/teichoic acid export membrane protein
MKLAVTPSLKRLWAAIRKDSLFNNSVYFFSNTISVSALGFVFWWFSARLYPADNVGGAVVIISAAQFITTISNFGLSFGLIRFLPNSQNKTELINFALTFVSGATSILVIGIILLGSKLNNSLSVFRQNAGYSALLFFFVISLAIYQLSSPIFAALKAGKLLLWVGLVTALGRLILVLILSVRPLTSTLILSYTLPTIAAAAVIFLLLLPGLIPGYSPAINARYKNFKYMVQYSLPSYAGNLFHDAPYQLLPQIVAYQFGVASAAYFYIVWSIFGLITTLGNSISLSLFVEGSYDSGSLPPLVRKAFTSTVGMTIFIAIVIIFLAEPVLRLYGADYAAQGVSLLRIVSLASIPAVIIYNKVAELRVEMRLRKIVAAFAMIALISLTLSITGLARDLVAIGYIWLFAQTITAVYILIT